MSKDKEIQNKITKIVKQVLLLSEDLKANLKGVYDKNNLRNALVALIVSETALYKKLATIFETRSASKIVEFASIARLILESHAVICWILESEGNEQVRAGRFMDTGWDLQKHYNNLFLKGYGRAKRTRHRLPTTETLIKTMNTPELVNWYDELNFYIHPSTAILTQQFPEGLLNTIDFGVFVAGNVYADSILKVAKMLNFEVSIVDAAKTIHTFDIPDVK
ncbi:hypothetical protein EPN95_03230 [Patescibacteria group bacterium]|nr:MAG: hypothetical protein EPN95_03230 [Patescibacteria group bacterium]